MVPARNLPFPRPRYQTKQLHGSVAWLMLPILLVWWLGTCSSGALTLLGSNQLAFVNVDHAPMGACSTITYGYKGGTCGVGTSTGAYPFMVPYHDGVGGVLIALSDNSGLQLLPFVESASSISTNARYFPDTNVQRSLSPCTDEYVIAGSGLSFKHYSPAWLMPDLNTASLKEKKRYFLPATWLVFTVTNANSANEDFYFGLPTISVTQKSFWNGAYQGFAFGEAAVAVQRGSCELLSGTRLSSLFNNMTQGFAFHLSVPAAQTRTLMVVIGYYRSAIVDSRKSSLYYYTTLYPSIDSVIDSAFAGFGDAQTRCEQLATVMSHAGLNPFRQFLACHTLHSFMADTAFLIDSQSVVHWWEMEGLFNYINTFDLTVDHAFYDSLMQPWALRNVLDAFSGALPGTGYSYTAPLYGPTGTQVAQGFAFHHDMGLWPTSGTGPAYGANMGDEELQAWILSAGLYWSRTADHQWLTNNQALLQTCLNSMLLRDHTNAAARDGITKNVHSGEITTWDSLDSSLRAPAFSGRLAVRNWASYLALAAMFNQIGDAADAATCQNMAGVAAQTIVNRWNTYSGTLGYIPALLDNSAPAATVSMVEGLAYPAAMGLTNAIDRTGGPYASMLLALSNHMVAVLVPGRCLDSGSGAWMSTSASPITWQSKMFIAQYVAEAILGITNNVNGTVDQIHASVQIQGSQVQGYSDAFYGNGVIHGGSHYPRGVTTSLWWLNPTNNPAYPAPISAPAAPAITQALAGDRQVSVLWQGVAFANSYNLKRAVQSGGPYTAVTNGVVGASFLDPGLNNGMTYYYILTATNQVGESAPSPEVSATPVPSVGTNISAVLAGSTLTISWPASYVGWILQTNIAGLGYPAAWGDVPDSRTHSQMIFPIGGANDKAKFFRLRSP